MHYIAQADEEIWYKKIKTGETMVIIKLDTVVMCNLWARYIVDKIKSKKIESTTKRIVGYTHGSINVIG